MGGVLVAEERTEQEIKVRQVTDYQASWTEEERGGPGRFTFQLILDNGAEEYVLQPTAGDAKVIRKLLDKSKPLFFDLERKILISSNFPLGKIIQVRFPTSGHVNTAKRNGRCSGGGRAYGAGDQDPTGHGLPGLVDRGGTRRARKFYFPVDPRQRGRGV